MNERTDIYSTRLMLRRYRNVYINTRRESNVVRNIYSFESRVAILFHYDLRIKYKRIKITCTFYDA